MIKSGNKLSKIILIPILIFVAIAISFLPSHSAFADDPPAESSEFIVETTFFGNLKDDGKGCGVYTVLNLVVDILSIGVGILGVLGITIVGVQYLTAGGNEQQTLKAKRRLGEIIIGVIAYAVLYTFVQWLLPGGKLSTNTACQTISDEQLASIREAERAAKQEAIEKAKAEAEAKKNNGKTNTGSNSGTSGNSIQASTGAESIAKAAALLSWPQGTSEKIWHHNYNGGKKFKQWSDLGTARPNQAFMDAFDELHPGHWGYSYPANIGADCGKFVKVVLGYAQKYAGIQDIPAWGKGFIDTFSKSSHWQKVPSTSAQPGDICISSDHQKIYLGNKTVAEAGNHSKRFGHVHGGSEGSCKGYTVYRYVD